MTNSLPGPENIIRGELENGITVLVYENDAAQSVVMMGTWVAGSVFENPAKSGLAAMTAASLMRGTHTRDFDRIHASLENIGANLSVSGGVNRASFFGKSLAEDLSTLVETLSDVLRNPAFPVEQIERLRGEILTSLQIRQQDTRYRSSRAFREHLYPDTHPYHHSPQGTLETISEVKIADMEAFHRKHYGPAGMIVVIVGAVNAQEAVDTMREHLGDWQNVEQPPAPPVPGLLPIEKTRRVSVNVPGKSQSDMILGVPGPSRNAPDFRAASLANSILGQFGMMGRIGAEIRERLGLAYHASSRIEGGHGPGPWSVNAGVNPSNVQLATERIVGEIRRITAEPVSAEELADNQAYFIGHLPLQLENNEGIAGALLNMETYSLGLDYLVNYRDEIYSLTRDDLLQAAQNYWNPEAFVLAVAGPETSME